MAQGTATVTVTGSDSAGTSAEQVFAVTVPNRPPRAVGSIPEAAVFKYDTGRVDLPAYFADPDRDELGYAAETSNAGVAAVEVTGGSVRVVGVVPGAGDGDGDGERFGGGVGRAGVCGDGAEPGAGGGRGGGGAGAVQGRLGADGGVGALQRSGRR